jgi:hypothetical protein
MQWLRPLDYVLPSSLNELTQLSPKLTIAKPTYNTIRSDIYANSLLCVASILSNHL